MKKKIIVVSLFVLIIIAVSLKLKLDGTFNKSLNIESSIKFKEEYELLNNKETPTGKRYKSIDLNPQNRFVYADIDKIKEVINGTGVIYFGFPECPWCRNSVPVIEEAAKQAGIDKIYYLNVYDIRDEKKLDDNGNVITIKEGTEEYKDLLNLLGDSLPEYKGLNDPSIKRIYVPLVITVKNGKVIDSHLSTVESQKNPYVELTDDQYSELLKLYKDAFSQIANVCKTEC